MMTAGSRIVSRRLTGDTAPATAADDCEYISEMKIIILAKGNVCTYCFLYVYLHCSYGTNIWRISLRTR